MHDPERSYLDVSVFIDNIFGLQKIWDWGNIKGIITQLFSFFRLFNIISPWILIQLTLNFRRCANQIIIRSLTTACHLEVRVFSKLLLIRRWGHVFQSCSHRWRNIIEQILIHVWLRLSQRIGLIVDNITLIHAHFFHKLVSRLLLMTKTWYRHLTGSAHLHLLLLVPSYNFLQDALFFLVI